MVSMKGGDLRCKRHCFQVERCDNNIIHSVFHKAVFVSSDQSQSIGELNYPANSNH